MATPVVPSNTARVQLIDEFGVVYKATGGGSSVEIQVEGVDNASQTLVNFVSGTPANLTITNPSGGIVQLDVTAAGTGDVVGPASAVANNIAVFSGTTGKLIADGGTTIAAINSSIAGKLSTVTADAPLSGSGTTGSHLVISQSGVATNGYLSSTDWNTFNNKQAAGSYLTAVTADSPLSGSGTSGSHLVIANAAADGTTKGAAAFTASDFDAAAGVISIDYTNGQAADATHKGFLTSADWSTFNAKQPAGSYLTAVTADAPLSGSGTSGSHLVAAVFVGSGASHATGIVPDPGASAGTTKFLREDATWQVPAGGGGTVVFQNPGLRLTLTTGVPVTTSDVTAAGTLYWTPMFSGNVWYWDGAAWQVETITEQSLALTLTSGKNYDVFYLHGTGLVLSSAWTNDTTRADALGTQNGVTVLASDHTKLWIGTIRASGTNTTEDSQGGTTSQVGGKRFVWNTYNKVNRNAIVIDTTDAWAYTTATWRQENGASGNKVEYVTGSASTDITASYLQTVALLNTSGRAGVGVGIDSTTTPSGFEQGGYNGNTGAGFVIAATGARYQGYPGLGYHVIYPLEKGATVNSGGDCQFTGDNGTGDQTGLTVNLAM